MLLLTDLCHIQIELAVERALSVGQFMRAFHNAFVFQAQPSIDFGIMQDGAPMRFAAEAILQSTQS